MIVNKNRDKEVDNILKEMAQVKKKQEKNSQTMWVIFIVIGLNLCSIWLINSLYKQLDDLMYIAQNNQAEFKAIASKIGSDENEKLQYLKLQANQNVWRETACIQCHNTTALALPINKITINEAIDIVRKGTEKSLAGGMPTYSARNTRGRDSITDSELQMRFQHLYTKEFLSVANEKK